MRYEDASQSGSSNNENPVARDDSDALAAGARGPATGNVISGADTQTGPSGADLGAEGAHIVSISGAQGSDASFTGGKLAVGGEFGRLSIDGEGNYSYLANRDAPENSRDVFTYKLANAQGRSDSAALTIEIGKSPAVVQANAQQVIPGPDGVVVLPAGVDLADVHVSGRNLVIDLPDGTQMVIVDGAVFVPRLVLGDVEVPATNLAALLIDSEIRPAAGVPQSGGGNFEVPVGPLDPGLALGDLIPPTALTTQIPEFRETALDFDSEPTILIETPDQPAGIENATASVNENALPARGGEPAGSNSASTAETTTGTIVFESLDSPNVVTIGGVVVTDVGQAIAGTFGIITITSIADGAIGYSYTLGDNTIGDATQEVVTVVITDRDGDSDTATLTISIVDDAPLAVADVDSVREDGPLVADGNVLTGRGGSDANATDGTTDTPGADGISLTGISFGGTAGTVGAPLAGAFGSLVIAANGT
jgi:VCBS repeat-containing protein